MKIRKNDTVLVITGKDKGKKGKVRFAYPKDNRMVVEGINIVKRHTRATGQGKPGGILTGSAHLCGERDALLQQMQPPFPYRLPFFERRPEGQEFAAPARKSSTSIVPGLDYIECRR